MSTLTLAVGGFFVYAVDGGTCSAFAAPEIEDDEFVHDAALWIDGTVTNSTIDGVASGAATATTLSLAHCRMSFGNHAPAAIHNTEMVVNFASLCCGARLKSSWRTDHAKLFQVLGELSGGSITAYADAFTMKNAWRWRDCNHAEVVRQLTSLLVYETAEWSGVVTFTPLRKGGTSGLIEFSGNTTLGLKHAARKPEADSDEARRDMDASHAKATKRLCDPNGGTVVRPDRVDPTAGALPTISLPKGIREFLHLDESGRTAPSVQHAMGRPNCGARVMFL